MCLYVVRHNSQVVFETKMSLTEAIDTLRLIRSEKKGERQSHSLISICFYHKFS